MSDTYITSDQHFFHTNIIKYCNRPFQSVEEMDDTIITNFNKRVKKNDIGYFLGDFCAWFGSDLDYHNRFLGYLNRINCKNIFYIFGNHDDKLRKNLSLQSYFKWCKDYAEVRVADQQITLTHYSMRVWRNSHHGSWNLYGHEHCNREKDPKLNSLDVGLEGHDYYPWHFDEIREVMKTTTT